MFVHIICAWQVPKIIFIKQINTHITQTHARMQLRREFFFCTSVHMRGITSKSANPFYTKLWLYFLRIRLEVEGSWKESYEFVFKCFQTPAVIIGMQPFCSNTKNTAGERNGKYVF